MKLIDLVKEATLLSETTELNCQIIEALKGEILKTDEFKNVKQLNILPMPIVQTDKNGELIINNKDYFGEEPKIVQTMTYVLPDNYEFNEVVDLYSLELSPKVFDKESIDSLGQGVWLLPTIYDSSFEPTNEIRIKWSPDRMACSILGATPEEKEQEIINRILDKVKELLTKKIEPNIPYSRHLLVRVSPRSIKTITPQ